MNKDLPRVFRPRVQDFMQDFVYPKRPVIITGALEGWAAKNWDLQILKQKLGNKQFSFRTETGMRTENFSEMIDLIQNATPQKPAPYLRNIDLLKTFPELASDISPMLPYLANNWRNHWAWPKNWPHHVTRDLMELFISSYGTCFPMLHTDYWGMDGFLIQLYGSKSCILFAPEDTCYLYPREDNPLISSIDNFDQPDEAKFPEFHKANQYRVHLQAGEILYNPSWWHTTLTVETSITLIKAYWNRSNYPTFVNEIERVYKDCNKLKTRMKVQYFKKLGTILERSVDFN